MTEEELCRLEEKSWIIQGFNPYSTGAKIQTDHTWFSLIISSKPTKKGAPGSGSIHATWHPEEANQFNLDRALRIASKIMKDVQEAGDSMWADYDYCVYNFRTHERIPVSYLK